MSLYILTSNNNEKEEDNEESEPIKVFDFNGKKIEEINDSNVKTFFICTYYDKKSKKNYILTGNEGSVKSYDYSDNKLYNNYCSEDSEKNHGSIIVSEFDTGVKIIESSWDRHIRIWGFHDGILLAKINFEKQLHGICLWNDDDLFVGCGKSIKLIRLENGVIKKQITDYHQNDILTLRTLNHPTYGNCLISQGLEEGNMKILYFDKKI